MCYLVLLNVCTSWSPTSWQSRPAVQLPTYRSQEALERVVEELSKLPPLVTQWEVDSLKAQLAEAARGERFLLQGGDCAESFDDCNAATITNKLKILLQMSLVLVHGSKKRVIRVGRIAGQYAKPRSDDFETRNGVTLPSYRGDICNRPEFTAEAREPDPELLLRGYERAALTLNYIRALTKGGFADLHHPEYWDLDFVRHSPLAEEFHRMSETIGEALRFMENILGVRPQEIERVDFFTSHEGLHLYYEQAQTRRASHCKGGWYNLSCHFPWIGMRTADPDGAHVEYFRGISNPIAVKIGKNTTPDVLLRILDVLHPDNEPGRLTLIHRFGCSAIADYLPRLIETVRRSGKTVLWCCDAMHGNTRVASNGLKTRRFDEILGELEQAFDIHAACGSYLGGVHIELTGDNVTECMGGARGLTEDDLQRAYKSQVDPRLNYEQALEMAMLIARKMSRLT
ncbi:MAG: 3-deoxy-7-phosphoheptulonate synthase class II [Bryobacteraceae bacterium]|nr:3-deoxy-7-phosphoheptulonate synthase class II [Bryobacteraceae bacterium]